MLGSSGSRGCGKPRYIKVPEGFVPKPYSKVRMEPPLEPGELDIWKDSRFYWDLPDWVHGGNTPDPREGVDECE